MTAAAIVFVIILFIIYLIMPAIPSRNSSAYDTKHYAHRGLHGEGAPENSLAAFSRAVDAGYGIELDVQITRDRQLVVFHDDDLSRMCGAGGSLSDQTLEALSPLRLQGTDEGIPLFSDVLKLVNGRVPLLIELKNGPQNSALVDGVLKCLQSYEGPLFIESFSPAILYRVKKRAPHIVRGQLVGGINRKLRGKKRMASVILSCLLLNALSRPDFIAYEQSMHKFLRIRAQRALFGARTAVWTLRSRDAVDRFEAACDVLIFEGQYKLN